MDFLPRYFTYCALVGAFCLAFSAPAFAVLDDPNYDWRLSSSGDVYRVYAPSGARASSTFTPSSTFADGDSGGVIQSFAPHPLTIDGATGEVVSDLSRSLSVGDLVDGLGKMVSLDNPIGLTILGVSTLAPFASALYNDYEDSLSSSSSLGCRSTSYYYYESIGCGSGKITSYFGPFTSSYVPSDTCTAVPNSNPTVWNGSAYGGSYADNGSGPFASECPSSGIYHSTVPSNLPNWISSNWSSDNLANDATTVLHNNPSYGPDLATQLANNNAPMSSPVPYVYNPTSNSLSQSPTTITSTNPSTGDSTSTTTTPSFKVSPGTHGGLDVTKILKYVTTSCTAADSCTVTNNTIKSTTPKTVSPFVAPTTSTPTASTSSVKSFPLSLVVPAQSHAHCPKPLSFTAFSNYFTIPLTPLCNLAIDVNPYVESLGAVGAGIVIFR